MKRWPREREWFHNASRIVAKYSASRKTFSFMVYWHHWFPDHWLEGVLIYLDRSHISWLLWICCSKSSNRAYKSRVVRFCLRYGFPEIIRTDRGTEFNNDSIKDMNKLMDVKQVMSGRRSLTFAGMVKHFHKTTARLLTTRCFESLKDWSVQLAFSFFFYNASKSATVGFNTYYMTHDVMHVSIR